MQAQFPYSIFHSCFFPPQESSGPGQANLLLKKIHILYPTPQDYLPEKDIVFFDLETTGLDARQDAIIEMGAIRFRRGEELDRFSSLISTDKVISPEITQITGITASMLEGQPDVTKVLGDFLDFIDGAYLSAHNADFDMRFIQKNADQLGVELKWPCFCTFKLAKKLLPALESKGLDALAKHYDLTFVERHRSIGDILVSAAVFYRMMDEHFQKASQKILWKDFEEMGCIF